MMSGSLYRRGARTTSRAALGHTSEVGSGRPETLDATAKGMSKGTNGRCSEARAMEGGAARTIMMGWCHERARGLES